MAAGDAQRVWFPEMLEDLRAAWSTAMGWDDLARFCQRMTAKRRAIREARGIQPPRTRCPQCGAVSRSDISGVSVRSALFALESLGVLTEAEFKNLDRRWKKHRAVAGVDAYGRPAATAASDEHSSCCPWVSPTRSGSGSARPPRGRPGRCRPSTG